MLSLKNYPATIEMKHVYILFYYCNATKPDEQSAYRDLKTIIGVQSKPTNVQTNITCQDSDSLGFNLIL